MKNIIISGYYGFGNTGDEAILSSMIHQIRGKVSDCNFTVISGSIEDTKRLHGVDAVNRFDQETISRNIEKCDLVILGGGGLFQDHHKVIIADMFTQPGYGVSSHAIVSLIAKMHNKPLIYYAHGVGPIFSKESRTFVNFVSELADIITVRDRHSEDLLVEFGISPSKIKLGLDPAFGLGTVQKDDVNSILIKEKIPLDKKIVCVSVRSWIDKHLEKNYKGALSEALDIFLGGNDFNLLFIPFQSFVGDYDVEVEKDIVEMMKNKNRCYLLKGSYHPKEIAGIISVSALVIGMRYHSIVFSAISKVPFVALSYDEKVTNLTEELGLKEYCIEINSVNSDIIGSIIDEAMDNRDKIIDRLELFMNNSKERLDISPCIVRDFVEGSHMPEIIHARLEKMKLLDIVHNNSQMIIDMKKYCQNVPNLENQLKEKSNELVKFQESVINLEKKLKERDNAISILESQLKDKDNSISVLESQLKDKEKLTEGQNAEVSRLQEIIRQRDNSLSWRFSQFYGKYFKVDSRVTKFFSYFVNKTISDGSVLNKITSNGEVVNEGKYEDKYLQEVESISKSSDDIRGIIIYPPTVDYNIVLFQRPQHLANKLSDLRYLFFFCTTNECDNINGFYKIKNNCYVTNKYNLLTEALPKYIFLLSSTNTTISLDNIIKIKDKALIVYEYIDEIHQDIWGPNFSIDFVVKRHEYMIKNADIVIATADKLMDDVTKVRNENVYLVPNGVDYDHFHVKKSDNIPKDIIKIIKKGNPIIGYYGAIAKWFDYEIVKELAKKRPKYEIVLIGPDYDGSMRDQFENFENIHCLGTKNYRILPEYAVFFDVMTIPFLLNKITESTSPIKIFEYMALGKPVVTTDLRECRKYKSVLIGKSYSDFIEKIDNALQLRSDNRYLELLDKEAKENTWELRTRKIDEIIQDFNAKKQCEIENFENRKDIYFGQIKGRVSIVLPVYNQASFLEESVQSILRQTYQDFELIIVNDGSTDNIQPVLDKYANNPKILILNQCNQKLPNALNNGFVYARGEFYTWTSADNVMLPKQLEEQVAFLKKNLDVDMVYCDYEAIDDEGKPLVNSDFRTHNQEPKGSSFICLPRSMEQLNTVKDNFIGGCFMYRGLVGKIIGSYDPYTFGCEDYDYWMRINSLFTIKHLGKKDILYLYRVHDNTLNAKAKEFGIFEKVENLMHYDEERRRFYEAKFDICCIGKGPIFDNIENFHRKFGNNIIHIGDEEIKDINTYIANNRHNEKCIIFNDLRSEHFEKDPSDKDIYNIIVAQDINENDVDNKKFKSCNWIVTSKKDDFDIISRCNKVLCLLYSDDNIDKVSKLANSRLFYRMTRPLEKIKSPEIFVNRKLNVLIETTALDKGGLEQVIFDIVKNIDRNKFNLYIACIEKEGYVAKKCIKEGIRVYLINRDKKAYENLIRELKIDIINSHYSLFGVEIASKLDIPVISVLHNNYVWLLESEIDKFKDADKHIKRYVAVSKNVSRYSRNYFKISPRKIDIIPNGTDITKEIKVLSTRDKFGLNDEDYAFLNVSAYHPSKGHNLMISAMEDLAKCYPKIKIICVGHTLDEEYYNKIKNDVTRKHLEKNIIFTGFVSEEDLESLLHIADAFIMTSLFEGWSVSTMQAMSHGLPMILTDVGGSRDIIENNDIGIVVPNSYGDITNINISNVFKIYKEEKPSNIESLKTAIIDFYDNKEKWKLSGEKGILKIKERYGSDNMIRRYEKLFIDTYKNIDSKI